MLKGINKRIIIIKKLNSETIEEAYFILKNGNDAVKSAKKNEIVIEANKIITEYHSQQRQLTDKGSVQETNAEFEKFLHSKTESKTEEPDSTIPPPVSNLMNLSNLSNLSDEEIFEDSKFFEQIQHTSTPKDYFHSPNPNTQHFSNFSKKRAKSTPKKLRIPLGFWAGMGVMSAIIMAIKLIEYIIIQ